MSGEVSNQMTGQADEPVEAQWLAKQILAGRPVNLQELSVDEVGRLVHELQVHQIELEVQNEELRRIQVSLEEEKRKYADLYEFAPVGYFTLDREGIVLESNLTAADLLGVDRFGLINRPLADFVSREDLIGYHLYLDQAFRARTRQVCEIRIESEALQPRFIRLESLVVVVPEGEPDRCRVVMSDITDRKQLEQALRQSDERFSRVVSSISDHTYVGRLDERGNWSNLYTSPHVETMLGFDQDRFSQDWHFWQSLIHPDDLPIAENHQAKTGEGSEVEYRIRRADGAFIWVRDSRQVELERDADDQVKSITVYGVVSNITERKLAQEALERERALLAQRVAERTADLQAANAELARAVRLKDEFLANMSHELRTPLNAILGRAEMLMEGLHGDLNEKQNRSLRIVEESARHLLALINDILDVSKIEAGKLNLDVRPVSVQSVSQSSLRLIKETALQKRLEVSSSFDPAATKLRADERRLKQILVNLLSNAVKFTPEGGSIGLEVVGEPELAIIRFIVWDTGIGIPAEDMDRLFQPFIQLDSSLSRQYEGTGLGLSMVHRLTEMHGGSVTLESEPGVGSRFIVTLPQAGPFDGDSVTRLEADSPSLIDSPARAKQASLGSPLILLAEDNQRMIDLLVDYLPLQGYRLSIAYNGMQAIEKAREEVPDLILMDIQMPDVDGLAGIRQIRTIETLVQTPIIALTALVMPGDRERCLAAGADAYLSKPVSLKHLSQLIAEKLNGTAS